MFAFNYGAMAGGYEKQEAGATGGVGHGRKGALPPPAP